MSTNIDDIQYVPPPSIGHELGIMFGFIALMSLSMTLYALYWRTNNKRNARKEDERIAALKASGWLKEKEEGGSAGVGGGVVVHEEDVGVSGVSV